MSAIPTGSPLNSNAVTQIAQRYLADQACSGGVWLCGNGFTAGAAQFDLAENVWVVPLHVGFMPDTPAVGSIKLSKAGEVLQAVVDV